MRLREPRERAMGLWRAGERLAQQHLTAAWRRAYERAIARAVDRLECYTTMEELVTAYFDGREAARRDAWLAALCRTPDGLMLSVGIVEDAAFWRRFQHLVEATTADRIDR